MRIPARPCAVARARLPAMACTVLIAARACSRPPLVSHSFDTPGGVDFRLVRVPPNANPPSPRPIFWRDENDVPRFAGAGRGPIPAYQHEQTNAASPEPIGYIPQAESTFSYWEAASGIANEKGVMIAESTCSAAFGAEPVGRGGEALLGYMELSRIALERCATARAAVELMGSLAEEHGFAGTTAELSGAAESLAVVDGDEAWVMHLMADDSGASAIWAAQRLDEGHAAVVPNVFVIRTIPAGALLGAGGGEVSSTLDAGTIPARGEADGSNAFLLSASAREVALRRGLWRPGTPFDFAAIYSRGEARARYYCGRRQWRALSLFAPSLRLAPSYTDLIRDAPYPFSVVPDAPLSADRFMAIMRDTYEGTTFDLSRQAASGPFGLTDRYDGFKEPPHDQGSFERPIGTYRMAYSYVGEPSSSSETGGRPALFHFAPHASQTSVYLPILCAMAECPAPLASGSVRAIDRTCAYWAFRIVKHTARGLPWDRCLRAIQARQRLWEGRAAQIVDASAAGSAEGDVATSDALHALACDVVSDWWVMLDELLLRFGDGWEHEWDDNGESRSEPLAYPLGWLEQVGFFEERP